MEPLIRISHPTLLPVQSATSSGNLEWKGAELVSYSEERDLPGLAFICLDFGKSISFNSIEILPFQDGSEFFPETFRFDLSQDNVAWEPALQESHYKRNPKGIAKWSFSLIEARYLKFVSKISRKANNGKAKLQIGALRVLVEGIKEIKVSSEADRLSTKENLLDGRPDYGWISLKKDNPEEEFLIFDMGSIQRLTELRLQSQAISPTLFPESMIFLTSEDDLTWHLLHEENMFLSEPAQWYRWKFPPLNFRYLKILLPAANKAIQSSFVGIELYSRQTHKEDQRPLAEPVPYASVLRSGVTRLALDGEVKDGIALQSSDRRLRDATTEYKGSVELASDGEDKPLVVVQGNDKRLKVATELTSGLVRLARSGEAKSGLAVQSDDERLKTATTEQLGIVELAEDGETRPGVAVQGHDARLKKATKKSYGLVRLAEPLEEHPDRVVTGDDPRLRDATVTQKGILRLAMNGEESALAAVQGDDKRLKKATTELAGIVTMAKSGETKEGLVVQSNDKRLQMATSEGPGIVQFALPGSGMEKRAVEANDPRLNDSRNPLPHEHEYAPKTHDFNSHTGLLKMEGSVSSELKGIVPPPHTDSIIYSRNNAPGSGVVGLGGARGVVGFSEGTGILGVSKSKERTEAGVFGLSSGAPGGHFVSQSDYAVFANGMGVSSREWNGSGKALYALGETLVEGFLRISKESQEECIARSFKIDQRDAISAGDLLVTTDEPGVLAKSKFQYATNVVGICIPNPSLVLGKESKSLDHVLVALFGVVKLRVDAGPGSILPGDLLVSGLTSGHLIKADPAKLKVGSLVARALEPCKRDKGMILALLTSG